MERPILLREHHPSSPVIAWMPNSQEPRHSFWRGFWRYRFTLAGLTALILAITGELMMRQAGAEPLRVELGQRLMQTAVLLVSIIAWVWEGLRRPCSSRRPTASAMTTLPTRRVIRGEPPRNGVGLLQRAASALSTYRARLGGMGTLIGLSLVVVLAASCYLLLHEDFGNPVAPWIWLAMLIALSATFLGTGQQQAQSSLMPHDPDEPALEPSMSGAEWLALGGLLLLAAVLRLWNLETMPPGVYIDEGDRAVDARYISRGEPVRGGPLIFFGAGWWGVPNLYFWLVAQSLTVFGNTLAGARMIHGLAGIGTVWFTYRIGRLGWSPQVGLLSGGLLAVSDFAIQFSRTAGESTITQFTWIACIYFLYKAVKAGHAINWVLSGIAGGLSLYGYSSGRILPLGLAIVALYLLVRWGLAGLRRYLPGLALMVFAAALTFAPHGMYILNHMDDFMARYNDVSIFAPQNAPSFGISSSADTWISLLIHQFVETYSAFDVGHEIGPFYPTGLPILPVAWSALWVLGTAYLVWRAGDVRFAILGLWLLTGLAGAALTTDTPTLQRVTGMVPALALIPAVFLVRITATSHLRLPAPGGRRWLRYLPGGLAVLLIAVMSLQALTFYFDKYTADVVSARVSEDRILRYRQSADYLFAGRYASTLDPRHDMVYQLDYPQLLWGLGPTLFLADRVHGYDFGNASEELPVVKDPGKTLHFLIFPNYIAYLTLLQTYYPGGQLGVLNRPDGTQFCAVYTVDAVTRAARHQLHARYTPRNGDPIERDEPGLGTLRTLGTEPAYAPPDGLSYPAVAQWAGSILAPAYATYKLHLDTSAGGVLEIDGRAVMTMVQGNATSGDVLVVLSKGLHMVHLAGTLREPKDHVAVSWAGASGTLAPVAPLYLWSGPPGVLLGEAFPADKPDLLTAPQWPPSDLAPLDSRRDGVLGWKSIQASVGGTPAAWLWRGSLHIANAGQYYFMPQTDGRVSVWVDGQLVAGQGINGAALTPGDHALEVRFQAAYDNTQFEFYWRPPGGERSLLLPTVLLPPSDGVWFVDERPGVPLVDAALLVSQP